MTNILDPSLCQKPDQELRHLNNLASLSAILRLSDLSCFLPYLFSSGKGDKLDFSGFNSFRESPDPYSASAWLVVVSILRENHQFTSSGDLDFRNHIASKTTRREQGLRNLHYPFNLREFSLILAS
mmetsp:Transcript_4302/g.8507  ORF Transcript_4302/g.8507 Transcript_4302/m.8507 type:complete len:126 (+) Transcript_4302:933-1310(+)